MKTVQDQLAAVLAGVGPVAPLDVALHDAVGCILAADVVADADLPARPLAARDGYAVRSADTDRAGGAMPLHMPVAHGGLDGGADPVPILALPGHPVAAHVSFEVFVRPAVRAIAGRAELFHPSVPAAATHGWPSPGGVRQFVPAQLAGRPGEGYAVTPVADPAEVSLHALSRANALAVVPEGDTEVKPGDVVHCLVLEG